MFAQAINRTKATVTDNRRSWARTSRTLVSRRGSTLNPACGLKSGYFRRKSANVSFSRAFA
jgi:hypothetical protein